MNIQFYEEDHAYVEEDTQTRIPSVTQIIGKKYPVPLFKAVRRAGGLGQAVHKATELFDMADLHLECSSECGHCGMEIDRRLVPYVHQWGLFQEEKQVKLKAIEALVHAPIAGHMVAGKIDRIAQIDNDLQVIDIKTGKIPDSKNKRYGLQLAGYYLLANQCGYQIDQAMNVYVHPTRYEPVEYNQLELYRLGQEFTELVKEYYNG